MPHDGSIRLVYLPTVTIKVNHSIADKYTSPIYIIWELLQVAISFQLPCWDIEFNLHLLAKFECLRHLKQKVPPQKKTNMAMEHPPFEDVCPIENGDFPMSC